MGIRNFPWLFYYSDYLILWQSDIVINRLLRPFYHTTINPKVLWKCFIKLRQIAYCDTLAIPQQCHSTIWGCRLSKGFCNMFSGSSPCLLGQHGNCGSAQLPVELSEDMLQNLFHNPPPQTITWLGDLGKSIILHSFRIWKLETHSRVEREQSACRPQC